MSKVTRKVAIKLQELKQDGSDSNKIALKCKDCVICIREHLDYEFYRLEDRSDCPTNCALYKSNNMFE